VTVLVGVLTLPVIAVLPNTPTVTPLIYLVAALMGFTVACWCPAPSTPGAGLPAKAACWCAGARLCTALGMTDWLLQTTSSARKAGIWAPTPTPVSFIMFGTP
jgi:hypothetical protein